ncbi:hypothetical protein Holit_03045 [Hollandina sp. SP2]
MSSKRSKVITEQCKEGFEALTAKMRFFIGHYFLAPPLGQRGPGESRLHPPRPPSHPVRPLTAEVTVDAYLAGRHELGIKMIYLTGSPSDPANKGFQVWYKMAPPGGEPVKTSKELTESFYTRQRKDTVVFDYEDSGKTVFRSTGGKRRQKGPWEPLMSAVIP